jgi:hypothetical protein
MTHPPYENDEDDVLGQGGKTEDNHHEGETGIHGNRSCPEHDPNKHWWDDYAYVYEDNPEQCPNRFSDILKTLEVNKPEGDPRIYRFLLVYVDAESGKMDVLGNPGNSEYAAINLLTRAASLIAYTTEMQDNHEREKMLEMMGGKRMMRFDGYEIAKSRNPEDDKTRGEDGQYL